MGELAVVSAAFTAIVDTASVIQALGERYYEISEEWKDFPNKVRLLRRRGKIWLEELKRAGVSDIDVIDTLNESISLLNDEIDKVLRREEEPTDGATSSFKKELTVTEKTLNKEKQRLLDIDADRREPKGFIDGCVTRCCSNAHAIAFPQKLGRRIERLVEALTAIPELLKLKKEARAAATEELSRRPYSIRFRDDSRYVPFEESEKEIYSKLENLLHPGPVVVLLHGGPGRGKTTLARRVALRYNELRKSTTSCFFDQVILLECGPDVASSAMHLELLQYLGFNRAPSEKDQQSELGISQQLKGVLESQKYLIILDDVWKGGFLQYMVDHFGKEVKCLVTSQQEDVCFGLNCPSIHKIRIQDASLEVARKIVAGHVGFSEQHIPSQQILDVVDKLIEDTAGNPLALASVVSAINQDQKDDLQEWEEAYKNLIMLLCRESTSSIFGHLYPCSFQKTLEISVDGSISSEAKGILRLMYLCKGPSIPEEVIHFLHEMTQFPGALNFSKLANELRGQGFVKITCKTDNPERSWSVLSLQKKIQKDYMRREYEFFHLVDCFCIVDTKASAESETGTELENEDPTLKLILGALYFEEQFAKEARSYLKVPPEMFNDRRRTAFEPITRLLGQSLSGQWTPEGRTAAKQCFLKYFYEGELDDANISKLLKMSSSPATQLATLAAIDGICSIGETPNLSDKCELLPSLLSILSSDNSSIFQEKAASAVRYLARKSESNRLQIQKVGRGICRSGEVAPDG